MAIMLLEPYSLVGIAGRSFVLLLLTAAIAFGLRRRSAAVLHGIWTVGLAGSLATPVVMWLLPSWSLPLLPSEANVVSTMPATPSANQPTTPAISAPAPMGNDRRIAGDTPILAQPPAAASTASPQAGRTTVRRPSIDAAKHVEWPSLATVATAIWLVGVFAMLMRLLQQTMAMQRKLAQASEVDTAEWREQRNVAAQVLGLRANVALKRHSGALSPMVVGLFRPVVLLPGDSDSWPKERRQLVLLHELAHVKRRDVLTQMLACLACALHWFNPVCWFGLIQMRKLREMACDDLVLVSGQQPADYADVLLDVARTYRHGGFATAVGMAHTTNVENRILAILDRARTRVSLTRGVFRILLFSASALVLLIGSLRLQSRAAAPSDTKQLAGTDTHNTPLATEKKEPETTNADDNFHTMEVRITDEEGKPLEGAKLYISVWYAKGYHGKKVPKEYFADARGMIDLKLPRRLRILRLWPSKPGYVPLFVNFAEGTHENGRSIPDEYEFRLQRSHRLTGKVVDVDGNPVSKAKVQVRVDIDEPRWAANPEPMISTGLGTAITDENGRWQITNAPRPPENGNKDYEFQLRVTHPDFAGDTKWGELQRQQGISTEALRDGTATVTLNRGIAIKGSVTGPDGKPVTKGLVVWNDRPYWASGVNETSIDKSGHFETERFSPGKYPITVLAPGFAPSRQIIEVNQDLGKTDIQLQVGNRIRIRIVDQAGTPIPNAYVIISEWRGTEALLNQNLPNVPDSGIPRHANDEGVYQWDWAPDDGVQYRISAEGYDVKQVTLVAKQAVHQVELVRPVTIFGKVVDATSGNPIDRFRAIRVKAFRPNFYSTDFQAQNIAEGKDGEYELQINSYGQTGNRYRVRIEAEGFRTALGKKSLAVGDPPLEENFRLEPAPALVGEVIDEEGKPVDNFTVAIGTPTTSPHFRVDRPESDFGKAFSVRGSHRFELAATFEPRRIRVFNDAGFAEVLRQPDEPIGTLRLQPWAVVSGRLMQGEQPVGGEGIYFYPLVKRGLTEARFQDSFYTKTDPNGSFRFDRLPPMSGTLQAYLGPWRDSPLTSSESDPLDLRPGELREVTLGGEGATIVGRVVATGRSNEKLSKRWSLNYLVSRNHGVDYPKEATPLSFDPAGPLQSAWLRQPDFQSWVATRLNYFVKLSDDGRLQIYGVQPGEYDLVIQLYEEPTGCLVETIGEKVVPVVVTAEQAASGEMEIGNIEIPCRIGPRIGFDMRVFKFVDTSGRVRQVDDMKKQYVLLHAWATWCAPCVKSMPTLKATVERYSESPLTVVGLNVDEDTAAAKAMAKAQKMDWAQNYLGPDSELMRQLAVSSVPAYYLIGPDGKLIGSANQWEKIEPLLDTEIK